MAEALRRTASTPAGFAPTLWQAQVLSVPEAVNVAILGGRGRGATFAMMLDAMRTAELYGSRARMLFLRRTYAGAEDFVATTRIRFGELYGDAARYNSNSRTWILPTGATLEVGQIEDLSDWRKFQGRSFARIYVDEAAQWPDLSVIELLRSCLRAPKGVPVRMMLAANPGDVGHVGIYRRFIAGRQAWVPYTDERTKTQWVTARGTYRDNPHLDQVSYLRELEAATATNPELRKAWINDDWAACSGGAFFASVLDEARVAVGPWFPEEWCKWAQVQAQGYGGRYGLPKLFLGHDFGCSAPSATLVCWKSDGRLGPDGRFYSPGSIVLLDELVTNEPDSLTRGMGYTVPVLAEAIRELAKEWGCPPSGVADDAIFARTGSGAGSIAEELRAAGVHFYPARKADRRTGWEQMRRMLANAGKPDVPGLYVSRRCAYWWSTVPSLPRDPKRPDDVDTRAADHAADACRYSILNQGSGSGCLPSVGILGV